MFAPATPRLGRMQRGRGDALRELLSMPVDDARTVLLAAMCSPDREGGTLVAYVDAFAELVQRLQPDLTSWFAWIAAMPATEAEDAQLWPFNLLGEVARRNVPGAAAFLRDRVMAGPNWRVALTQFLRDGNNLSIDDWATLLPRLDEAELLLHCDPDQPLWRELAARDARCNAVLQVRMAQVAARNAARSWSLANYENAPSSSRRWQVVEDLLHRDPPAARSFLVDGLWDGDHAYRERCIEHCALDWPAVRERLQELAADPWTPVARTAQARLQRP
jgi:hypothetical protein